MKKSFLFVFALCLICMAACRPEEMPEVTEEITEEVTDGDIQFEKGNIPRDIAYKLVLKGIDHPLEDIDIWASKEKIKANTDVSSWGVPILSPGQESWLFFIDEVPNANWNHPCQYLFVDMDGKIYRHSDTSPYGDVDMDLLNMSEITSRWYSSQYAPQSAPVKRQTKSGNVPQLNNHYAIIVSGGGKPSKNYPRYWNDCAEIYVTLTEQYGYNPSKIFVLMADGTDPGIDNSAGLSSNPDLDGDGIDDIDYAATNQNLDNVFQYLSSHLSEEDYLFIYTIDHGGMDFILDESYLLMWNNAAYYASRFANKVKAINTKATHIVMGQCHSGGFVEYFTDSPNICISAACGKYGLSYATPDLQFDEFVHLWTQSHQSSFSDTNNDNHISARESFLYAESRDTRMETPCHYGGADYLSDRLALTGIKYSSYINGYCDFGNNYTYSFYAIPHFFDPDLHEPEFGIARGGDVDIYVTQPVIPAYHSFNWSITENSSYTSVFSPNNTRAYMRVNTQATIGQRVRVKVEANIPEDNYYVSQYLNFYITSNYYIARTGSNTLSIIRDKERNSPDRISSSETFEYQILDPATKNVQMRGSKSNKQKADVDISKLTKGKYTLIIQENGKVMADQSLTIP